MIFGLYLFLKYATAHNFEY